MTHSREHLNPYASNGNVDIAVVAIDRDRVSPCAGDIPENVVGLGINHGYVGGSKVIAVISRIEPDLISGGSCERRENIAGSHIYSRPTGCHHALDWTERQPGRAAGRNL